MKIAFTVNGVKTILCFLFLFPFLELVIKIVGENENVWKVDK